MDDGAIKRNPCRIKGAGQEKSAERPVLTVAQVFALAEAIEPRYQALVLMGALTSLRWGELCALRQSDIDLEARTVRVERSLDRTPAGRPRVRPAEVRRGHPDGSLPRPDHAGPALASVLLRLTRRRRPGFTGPNGALLRRSNFQRRTCGP